MPPRADLAWPPAPEPLPSPVVDNHTHLDFTSEAAAEAVPVADQIAKAAAVGVPRMIQIGCDLPSARWTDGVVREFDALLGGVAIHPNEAPRLAADGLLEDAIAEIRSLLAGNERLRVVGETGLDFFRTGPELHEVQRHSFREHIAIAKELDRALQIHDRDAHAEVLRVLDEVGAPERTVFHCFSGDAEMARYCVERGWSLSFAGTVTFRNAGPLRAALSVVPLDRVLVETDAPYLTPHPFRGRPNAPYLVPITMRTIADVLGVDLERACRAVRENTEAMYGSG
jgi:TatD DNase family protein